MATLTSLVSTIQTVLTVGSGAPFTPTTAFYSFSPQDTLAFPPNDQFAVIQPERLEINTRTFGSSAPGLNFIVTWYCSLWLFVRLSTDESNQDTNYLLDATYGSIALTDSVIDLFQTYNTQAVPRYELDAVHWTYKKRESTGWGSTQLKFHTDLAPGVTQ